jgi:hypothetical protein
MAWVGMNCDMVKCVGWDQIGLICVHPNWTAIEVILDTGRSANGFLPVSITRCNQDHTLIIAAQGISEFSKLQPWLIQPALC